MHVYYNSATSFSSNATPERYVRDVCVKRSFFEEKNGRITTPASTGCVEHDRNGRPWVMPLVKSHFLDSGAFSLHKEAVKWAEATGRPKEAYWKSKTFRSYMDDYAIFVKEHHIAIDLYANVDVIRNAELTYRNQKYLEKRHGLTPIPVVHYPTDVKWLQRYMDEGYEMIGLGGLVGRARHQTTRVWIQKCFELVCDTPDRCPKVKIHGFGVTSFDLMMGFPWWSVDSTSWIKTGVYGYIYVPKKRDGSFFLLEAPDKYLVSAQPVTIEAADKGWGRTGSGKGVGRVDQYHYDRLSEKQKASVKEWLDLIGVEIGETKDGEVVQEGVTNNSYERTKACLLYFEKLIEGMPEYPQPLKSRRTKGFGLC